MSRTEELVKCLLNLKNIKYTTPAETRESNAKAERLLNLIFQIGKQNPTYTKEEKEILGTLLAGVIQPIQVNIERAASISRTRLDTCILRKRSALQFLIENFGSFPVEGAECDTLSSELAKALLGYTIKLLDDIIDKWGDAVGSNEASDARPTENLRGVPASHTWWSR